MAVDVLDFLASPHLLPIAGGGPGGSTPPPAPALAPGYAAVSAAQVYAAGAVKSMVYPGGAIALDVYAGHCVAGKILGGR